LRACAHRPLLARTLNINYTQVVHSKVLLLNFTMDRDEQILFLFLAMCQEIYDRYKQGQTINQSEKIVAIMFMARVLESYQRICKRSSVNSQEIFKQILSNLKCTTSLQN